jgi:hypothetical protein
VSSRSSMPTWLKVMLIAIAVVVLGPPLLVMALAALGVAIGLAAAGLKIAVVVLGVYALYLLLDAVFGKAKNDGKARLDDSLSRLEELESHKKNLDDELARAVAATQK